MQLGYEKIAILVTLNLKMLNLVNVTVISIVSNMHPLLPLALLFSSLDWIA